MSNNISAVTARTQLGQILKRAEERDERFVVDRRGEPSVIIMSVKDYIRNIAPPTAATAAIREDARRKGVSGLSMADINRVVATVRRQDAPKKNKRPVK
jgi:prevent-host-death family protein